MSLIFQNGSRTQSYGPGEKMPALPPQPKASFGKPPGSSQDYYLHKQPAGGTQYAGGTPDWRNVGKPGQAQSTPAPSQGTKYGAYSPRPPSSQTTGDPRGAYATFAPSQRPPPIQMGVAQTPWGQSMDPFAERDAFVRQIGQQRINNQIAFNTSGPNAPQGSPFINYGMAAQNAGLAGGAPSMNADPADTFIGRFNNQYGAPVNPGFGGGQPSQPIAQPPQAGIRSAADSPTSPEYQKWRSEQARTMEWRGPEGEAKREADMHRRWMEETGRAPASGDFRPKPGAPQGPRMPYAGGMDYEQGPPVQRPGLTLRPPPRRTGMAGYQTTRRR